jgi:hypothetical protein
VSYLELAKALEARLHGALSGGEISGRCEEIRRAAERIGPSGPGQPSDGEALLDRLLARGATFEVISEGGLDVLLWFGPGASVVPEVQAQVTTHKTEFISLLRGGFPRSRRSWGEPTPADWREHPDGTADAEEAGL